MKISVGIDYSITSPSMCIHTGSAKFSYKNCSFYILTGRKNLYSPNRKYQISFHSETFKSPEERFDNISNWCMESLSDYKGKNNVSVLIEGYAFAAKGLVFHVGENTGLLKHKLFKMDYIYNIVPPSTVKKFATGKGNATKQMMYEKFLEDTKEDLLSLLKIKHCDINPISDIVDSYFLSKYCYEKF